MLNHIRAAALMAVLAVTSGSAAEAATLGLVPTNDPLLTASDVSIDFSSAFGGFYYVAGNILAATANGAPLVPAPADFVIEGPSLDDLLLDVFADGGVDAFLSGEVTAVGYGDGVIELALGIVRLQLHQLVGGLGGGHGARRGRGDRRRTQRSS